MCGYNITYIGISGDYCFLLLGTHLTAKNCHTVRSEPTERVCANICRLCVVIIFF